MFKLLAGKSDSLIGTAGNLILSLGGYMKRASFEHSLVVDVKDELLKALPIRSHFAWYLALVIVSLVVNRIIDRAESLSEVDYEKAAEDVIRKVQRSVS